MFRLGRRLGTTQRLLGISDVPLRSPVGERRANVDGVLFLVSDEGGPGRVRWQRNHGRRVPVRGEVVVVDPALDLVHAQGEEVGFLGLAMRHWSAQLRGTEQRARDGREDIHGEHPPEASTRNTRCRCLERIGLLAKHNRDVVWADS
jgi:hypothetical protein